MELTLVEKPSAEQFQQFADIFKDEGWGNFEAEDFNINRGCSATNLIVAVSDSGEVISGIIYTHHKEPGYAYIGLYMTKKGFRGLGYGKLVWDAVLAKFAASATPVALHSTSDMTPKYRAAGLRYAAPWELARIVGPARSLKDELVRRPRVPGLSCAEIPRTLLTGSHIIAYDEFITKRNRREFYALFAEIPSLRVFTATKGDGSIGGLLCSRLSGGAIKIGPLLCDSLRIAEQLLLTTATALGDVKVSIVPPTTQSHFLTFLIGLAGFKETLRLALSCTTALPEKGALWDRVFSQTGHGAQYDA